MFKSKTRVYHYAIAYDNIQSHDEIEKAKKSLRRVKNAKFSTSSDARLEDSCSNKKLLEKKLIIFLSSLKKSIKIKKTILTEKRDEQSSNISSSRSHLIKAKTIDKTSSQKSVNKKRRLTKEERVKKLKKMFKKINEDKKLSFDFVDTFENFDSKNLKSLTSKNFMNIKEMLRRRLTKKDEERDRKFASRIKKTNKEMTSHSRFQISRVEKIRKISITRIIVDNIEFSDLFEDRERSQLRELSLIISSFRNCLKISQINLFKKIDSFKVEHHLHRVLQK